jgi:hypothetical protein
MVMGWAAEWLGWGWGLGVLLMTGFGKLLVGMSIPLYHFGVRIIP